MIDAAQSRNIREEKRPLKDAPDSQILSIAWQNGRNNSDGQSEAARLMEEEHLVAVIGRVGRRGFHSGIWVDKVEVNTPKSNDGVKVLEEEGVESRDDGRRV